MDDDDRTTVMARELTPFRKRRGQVEGGEWRFVPTPAPSRSQPIAQIEEQTVIGQTIPRAPAKATTRPTPFPASFLRSSAPASPRPAAGVPASSSRRNTPLSTPVAHAGYESRTRIEAPRSAPPPPHPALRVEDVEEYLEYRPPMPSEPPSSSVFVRDTMASSPSIVKRRLPREPMLLAAAGLGMLGMIFTLGIVCGLVVSLRGRASAPGADASLDSTPPPVVFASAVAPRTDAPLAPVLAAPMLTPSVTEPISKNEASKTQPAKSGSSSSSSRSSSSTSHSDSARVARAASASAPPASKSATAKKRTAPTTEPGDLDEANAVNELARAQLDTSLH